jgi:Protein of unknown function (DUF2510)
VKLTDAPPPGWYPDPKQDRRLRWWDGADWSTYVRPVPLQMPERVSSSGSAMPPGDALGSVVRSVQPQVQQFAREARDATGREIDAAVDRLTQQAIVAARQIQPLISEYTNRTVRVLRKLLVVAVIALVAWFLFQAIAQQTLLEWIDHQIDKFRDSAAVARRE